MKAEINSTNKAKFFAQYSGQRIICAKMRNFKQTPWEWEKDKIDYSLEIMECWAELKSLSAITDEDAIELGYQTDDNPNSFNYGFSPSSCFMEDTAFGLDRALTIHQIDLLRAKGYAVEWMGLSVEELIEAGWVKLKGGSNA